MGFLSDYLTATKKAGQYDKKKGVLSNFSSQMGQSVGLALRTGQAGAQALASKIGMAAPWDKKLTPSQVASRAISGKDAVTELAVRPVQAFAQAASMGTIKTPEKTYQPKNTAEKIFSTATETAGSVAGTLVGLKAPQVLLQKGITMAAKKVAPIAMAKMANPIVSTVKGVSTISKITKAEKLAEKTAMPIMFGIMGQLRHYDSPEARFKAFAQDVATGGMFKYMENIPAPARRVAATGLATLGTSLLEPIDRARRGEPVDWTEELSRAIPTATIFAAGGWQKGAVKEKENEFYARMAKEAMALPANATPAEANAMASKMSDFVMFGNEKALPSPEGTVTVSTGQKGAKKLTSLQKAALEEIENYRRAAMGEAKTSDGAISTAKEVIGEIAGNVKEGAGKVVSGISALPADIQKALTPTEFSPATAAVSAVPTAPTSESPVLKSEQVPEEAPLPEETPAFDAQASEDLAPVEDITPAEPAKLSFKESYQGKVGDVGSTTIFQNGRGDEGQVISEINKAEDEGRLSDLKIQFTREKNDHGYNGISYRGRVIDKNGSKIGGPFFAMNKVVPDFGGVAEITLPIKGLRPLDKAGDHTIDFSFTPLEDTPTPLTPEVAAIVTPEASPATPEAIVEAPTQLPKDVADILNTPAPEIVAEDTTIPSEAYGETPSVAPEVPTETPPEDMYVEPTYMGEINPTMADVLKAQTDAAKIPTGDQEEVSDFLATKRLISKYNLSPAAKQEIINNLFPEAKLEAPVAPEAPIAPTKPVQNIAEANKVLDELSLEGSDLGYEADTSVAPVTEPTPKTLPATEVSEVSDAQDDIQRALEEIDQAKDITDRSVDESVIPERSIFDKPMEEIAIMELLFPSDSAPSREIKPLREAFGEARAKDDIAKSKKSSDQYDPNSSEPVVFSDAEDVVDGETINIRGEQPEVIAAGEGGMGINTGEIKLHLNEDRITVNDYSVSNFENLQDHYSMGATEDALELAKKNKASLKAGEISSDLLPITMNKRAKTVFNREASSLDATGDFTKSGPPSSGRVLGEIFDPGLGNDNMDAAKPLWRIIHHAAVVLSDGDALELIPTDYTPNLVIAEMQKYGKRFLTWWENRESFSTLKIPVIDLRGYNADEIRDIAVGIIDLKVEMPPKIIWDFPTASTLNRFQVKSVKGDKYVPLSHITDRLPVTTLWVEPREASAVAKVLKGGIEGGERAAASNVFIRNDAVFNERRAAATKISENLQRYFGHQSLFLYPGGAGLETLSMLNSSLKKNQKYIKADSKLNIFITPEVIGGVTTTDKGVVLTGKELLKETSRLLGPGVKLVAWNGKHLPETAKDNVHFIAGEGVSMGVNLAPQETIYDENMISSGGEEVPGDIVSAEKLDSKYPLPNALLNSYQLIAQNNDTSVPAVRSAMSYPQSVSSFMELPRNEQLDLYKEALASRYGEQLTTEEFKLLDPNKRVRKVLDILYQKVADAEKPLWEEEKADQLKRDFEVYNDRLEKMSDEFDVLDIERADEEMAEAQGELPKGEKEIVAAEQGQIIDEIKVRKDNLMADFRANESGIKALGAVNELIHPTEERAFMSFESQFEGDVAPTLEEMKADIGMDVIEQYKQLVKDAKGNDGKPLFSTEEQALFLGRLPQKIADIWNRTRAYRPNQQERVRIYLPDPSIALEGKAPQMMYEDAVKASRDITTAWEEISALYAEIKAPVGNWAKLQEEAAASVVPDIKQSLFELIPKQQTPKLSLDIPMMTKIFKSQAELLQKNKKSEGQILKDLPGEIEAKQRKIEARPSESPSKIAGMRKRLNEATYELGVLKTPTGKTYSLKSLTEALQSLGIKELSGNKAKEFADTWMKVIEKTPGLRSNMEMKDGELVSKVPPLKDLQTILQAAEAFKKRKTTPKIIIPKVPNSK